jgi:hypothetical protein
MSYVRSLILAAILIMAGAGSSEARNYCFNTGPLARASTASRSESTSGCQPRTAAARSPALTPTCRPVLGSSPAPPVSTRPATHCV